MFKSRINQAHLIDNKPFIFEESKSDISKDQYIEWVMKCFKNQEDEFHIFDVPYPYKFSIVDKYKKNIVTTGYQANPNGSTSLFTIFQLNKKNHAIGTYHFDVEDLDKDFMSVVLLSSDSMGMIKFVKDNKDHEDCFEKSRSTGFGAITK